MFSVNNFRDVELSAILAAQYVCIYQFTICFAVGWRPLIFVPRQSQRRFRQNTWPPLSFQGPVLQDPSRDTHGAMGTFYLKVVQTLKNRIPMPLLALQIGMSQQAVWVEIQPSAYTRYNPAIELHKAQGIRLKGRHWGSILAASYKKGIEYN